MDKIVSLAKRRGFIFPGSEIYGGLQNSWDYGPLGVELKNNIKREWWKRFVHHRADIVGLDAALIMNPKVWEASGHVSNFADPLVECRECHKRFRADHVNVQYEGPRADVLELGDEEDVLGATWVCENCGANNLGETTRQFNLMFKTSIGPVEEASNAVYLRPETAQSMFVNFKNILDASRPKLPFGIAQIGKAFRNEITPGNFIFRTREFEQMEIEYFIAPPASDADWQAAFEEWRQAMRAWIRRLGIPDEMVHELEVPAEERAHYSKRTVDFEFDFPFGRKELYGLAYRTDFDLKRHGEVSGTRLEYRDEERGETYVPHVIEPSWGVDRTVLAVLAALYAEEEAPTAEEGETETRVVMKFPNWLAPVKVAVLPLSKKEELAIVARRVANSLRERFVVEYDETQSIGKRYRRQDEIGTPYCVTIDFDTVTMTGHPASVTVRDRDTMKQERILIAELAAYLGEKLAG